MNCRYSAMWSKTDSELKDIPRKCGLKGHTALPGCYEAPSNFSSQSIGYLLSDKKISIIATLHFGVIVRRVMALSLERRNLFVPAKKLLDEQALRWEVVHTQPKLLCKQKVKMGGATSLNDDEFTHPVIFGVFEGRFSNLSVQKCAILPWPMLTFYRYGS
jgi:hypothetical protein